MAVGTLRVTDQCVLLEEGGGESVILVWPEDRTSWDEESESITFEQFNGDSLTVEDGDALELGGGGDSVHESGRGAEEWRGAVDWVAEPPLDCVTDGRWMIGDVERR